MNISIADVCKIAERAGAAIMKIYAGDAEVEYKEDNSPLTAADKASHQVINAALAELYPTIPVLSEEGTWRALNPYSQQYLFLEKSSSQGHQSVYICVNKSTVAETEVEEWAVPEPVRENCSLVISLLSVELRAEPIPLAFTLDPADVVLFLSQ